MRLRLSVQRNNLPPTNVLWNVPDTNSSQAYTIVRLLEDVNKVLPLEAEQWGLEDYIVEVGGFECLHFSPVAQLLKDDDHVSIRPLLTAEVRSRTLCGRHQISEDGRRLVDGIPFGRPHLRQPLRPSVRIPPRKRQRLENDDEREEDENEEMEMTGLITNGEPTPSSGGSESVNFHDDGSDLQNPNQGCGAKRKRRATFVVEDDVDDEEELDDSEDDNSFAPSEASKSDDSRKKTDSSDISGSDSEHSGAESDSDSDSESETESSDDSGSLSSAPELRTSKPRAPVRPPSYGSEKTKKRNIRRRDSGKLRQMKASGLIRPDATLTDLHIDKSVRASLKGQGLTNPMCIHIGSWNHYDEEDAKGFLSKNEELEWRRQELMANVERDAARPGSSDAATANAKTPELATSGEATAATASKKQSMDADPPLVRKRLLPDTNAIRRILLHQAKNNDKKPPRKLPFETTPEPEDVTNPDFWKSRINLSAFECWNEEFGLSAPPFPFKQHWDPASKAMRDKTNIKKTKKKAKRVTVNADEAGIKEEDVNETPVLDYGESPDLSRSKQDSDMTIAIGTQLTQNVEAAAQSDPPSIPDDVATLPALEAKDIQPGAIIIFKEFVINPETVTPEISPYKTGVVEKEGDSGAGAGTFRLRIAARDVPKAKPVRQNGKMAQTAGDAFRMIGEEEEQDARLWEGIFGQLLEPKLLVPVGR